MAASLNMFQSVFSKQSCMVEVAPSGQTLMILRPGLERLISGLYAGRTLTSQQSLQWQRPHTGHLLQIWTANSRSVELPQRSWPWLMAVCNQKPLMNGVHLLPCAVADSLTATSAVNTALARLTQTRPLKSPCLHPRLLLHFHHNRTTTNMAKFPSTLCT